MGVCQKIGVVWGGRVYGWAGYEGSGKAQLVPHSYFVHHRVSKISILGDHVRNVTTVL